MRSVSSDANRTGATLHSLISVPSHHTQGTYKRFCVVNVSILLFTFSFIYLTLFCLLLDATWNPVEGLEDCVKEDDQFDSACKRFNKIIWNSVFS